MIMVQFPKGRGTLGRLETKNGRLTFFVAFKLEEKVAMFSYQTEFPFVYLYCKVHKRIVYLCCVAAVA